MVLRSGVLVLGSGFKTHIVKICDLFKSLLYSWISKNQTEYMYIVIMKKDCEIHGPWVKGSGARAGVKTLKMIHL